MSPLAILQWVAAAIVSAVLFVGGCSYGKNQSADTIADLRVEHADTLRKIAGETVNAHEAAAAAAEAVRKSDQAKAQAIADAERHAQERIAHAEEDAIADTRACFLSGRCKLRGPWSCPAGPAAAAGLPGAAADPSDAADRSGLREAAVGRVLGIGRRANELVKLCVATLKTERAKAAPEK